jgi:hypothetical protein
VSVAKALDGSTNGARRAVGVGIDGVLVDKATLRGSVLLVNVTNVLEEYGTPTGGRRLRVTVRCEAPCEVNEMILNGRSHKSLTADSLALGLYTTV